LDKREEEETGREEGDKESRDEEVNWRERGREGGEDEEGEELKVNTSPLGDEVGREPTGEDKADNAEGCGLVDAIEEAEGGRVTVVASELADFGLCILPGLVEEEEPREKE
jgi:hypothetical protein